MNETVAGAKAEEVGAVKAVYVAGDMNENVGGNRRETITRHYTYTMDELHIRIDKNYNIKAMNTNTEIAGSAFFRVGKKLIEAEEIEFRAGKARLTLKNQLITIEGNNISMKSMGDVKLKGKNIYKEDAEQSNQDKQPQNSSLRWQALNSEDSKPIENIDVILLDAKTGEYKSNFNTSSDGRTDRLRNETTPEHYLALVGVGDWAAGLTTDDPPTMLDLEDWVDWEAEDTDSSDQQEIAHA